MLAWLLLVFFIAFCILCERLWDRHFFLRQLCSTFTQRLDVICLGSIYFPIQSKRANNIHYFDCFARSVHKAHTYTHKTYPFSRFQRATRSHSQITASLDEHFLGLSFFHRNQTKLKVIHFIFFSSFICFQLLKFLLFSVLILGIAGWCFFSRLDFQLPRKSS